MKDSWLSILISVITLLLIAALILYPSFVVLRFTRQESPRDLYSHDSRVLSRYGPLFAQYRHQRYYFFLALLAAFVLRAIFISFAKGSGIAQIALLMALELGLMLSHFILRPAKTRGNDVFLTYLAITRFACTALMIAFIERLQVDPIPRVVIGIIIAIVWSVAVLVIIGNLAWHAVAAIVKLAKGRRQVEDTSTVDSPVDSEKSMVEKVLRPWTKRGGSTQTNLVQPETATRTTDSDNGTHHNSGDSEDGIEEVARGRPVNPTPEHNQQHFDPYLLTPYPISPTGSTVTTMDPPSLNSRDSGTITVGSLLPRRWSFSLSQPGSPADSGFSHGNSRDSAGYSASPPSSPSNNSYAGHSQQSHSSYNSAVSRNSSARTSAQPHQLRHEGIAEEEEGSSPTTVVPPS